jgi:hypothetical protein
MTPQEEEEMVKWIANRTYYLNARENRKEYKREYYDKHKEHITQYQREYYAMNPEKYNKKVKCECGAIHWKASLKRHKTTKLHAKRLAALVGSPKTKRLVKKYTNK